VSQRKQIVASDLIIIRLQVTLNFQQTSDTFHLRYSSDIIDKERN